MASRLWYQIFNECGKGCRAAWQISPNLEFHRQCLTLDGRIDEIRVSARRSVDSGVHPANGARLCRTTHPLSPLVPSPHLTTNNSSKILGNFGPRKHLGLKTSWRQNRSQKPTNLSSRRLPLRQPNFCSKRCLNQAETHAYEATLTLWLRHSSGVIVLTSQKFKPKILV